MKVYFSNTVRKFMFQNHLASFNVADCIETYAWAIGWSKLTERGQKSLEEFVAKQKPLEAAVHLNKVLTPAEFRSLVGLRVWYRNIEKQCLHYSPKVWHNLGSYVVADLNTGRTSIFIDSHAND